jgi:peptidyl-prolyl cis-trans isomerase B (cyclophilin B)
VGKKMRRFIHIIILSGAFLGTFMLINKIGAKEPAGDVQPSENPLILLKTTKGELLVELFSKNAPEAVSFFLEQVKKGNYNRLPFNRYAGGFAIQLARPKKVNISVAADERYNGLSHLKGTVGLAWDYVKNKTGSKLYVCLSRIPHLDDKHTVIGQVVEGLEVLSTLRPGDIVEQVNQLKQPSKSTTKAKK